MIRFPPTQFCLPALLLAAAFCAGCESPSWVRSLNEAFASRPAPPSAREEEEHRREFQATRSRQSRLWLLAHCVDAGMSFDEVSRTLGERGVYEPNANWLREKASGSQVSDDVYSFGPDSEGETLYLFFREKALVNFDPEALRKSLKK